LLGDDEHLQCPHFLSGGDLAAKVRRYLKTFNLHLITSAKIHSAVYDRSTRRWVVRFESPHGRQTAIAKHLVQATGFGSQKPHLPLLANEEVFRGISIHSMQYKNAALLKERGVKASILSQQPPTPFSCRCS